MVKRAVGSAVKALAKSPCGSQRILLCFIPPPTHTQTKYTQKAKPDTLYSQAELPYSSHSKMSRDAFLFASCFIS